MVSIKTKQLMELSDEELTNLFLKYKEELRTSYAYLSDYDEIFNLALKEAISDIFDFKDDVMLDLEKYLKIMSIPIQIINFYWYILFWITVQQTAIPMY